jgi:hypothetical protein
LTAERRHRCYRARRIPTRTSCPTCPSGRTGPARAHAEVLPKPRAHARPNQLKGLVIPAEQAGMPGIEHASVELTVSVEVPCPECGGRGYVEKVGGTGRRLSDRTQPCLPCSGKGLIPKNMPLSQFQALLASQAR